MAETSGISDSLEISGSDNDLTSWLEEDIDDYFLCIKNPKFGENTLKRKNARGGKFGRL